MAKKYKFILTLPYDIKIDSAEEIEDYRVYPSSSQSEPYNLKGIFDTFEEAKEAAEKFDILKVIITYKHLESVFCKYFVEVIDSFEDEDEDPIYFLDSPDNANAYLECRIDGFEFGDIYLRGENFEYEETQEVEVEDEIHTLTTLVSFEFDLVKINNIEIIEFECDGE